MKVIIIWQPIIWLFYYHVQIYGMFFHLITTQVSEFSYPKFSFKTNSAEFFFFFLKGIK